MTDYLFIFCNAFPVRCRAWRAYINRHKWPPPIRWQIAAEWLDTAQWSQRSANRKTAIALSSGTIDDRLRPSLPSKLGSQMHPSWYVEFQVPISPQRITDPLRVSLG